MPEEKFIRVNITVPKTLWDRVPLPKSKTVQNALALQLEKADGGKCEICENIYS